MKQLHSVPRGDEWYDIVQAYEKEVYSPMHIQTKVEIDGKSYWLGFQLTEKTVYPLTSMLLQRNKLNIDKLIECAKRNTNL